MVTASAEIQTTQTAFYGVRQGVYVTLSTIHISNPGVAGTFTLYARPAGMIATPITVIDQAIGAGDVAICADPLVLSAGTVLEAVANIAGMTLLITGVEGRE
jgi:hypothetical protein